MSEQLLADLYAAAMEVISAYRYPAGVYEDCRDTPFHQLIEGLEDACGEVDAPPAPGWDDCYFVTAAVKMGPDRGLLEALSGPYESFALAAERLPHIRKRASLDYWNRHTLWGVTGFDRLSARFVTPRYPVDAALSEPTECQPSLSQASRPRTNP